MPPPKPKKPPPEPPAASTAADDATAIAIAREERALADRRCRDVAARATHAATSQRARDVDAVCEELRARLAAASSSLARVGADLRARLEREDDALDDATARLARRASDLKALRVANEAALRCVFYLITPVPARPRRRRGERRSLRTFPPGVLCFSPPTTPRFQSRRTRLPRRLSTPLLTPFDSAPTSLRTDNHPRPRGIRARMPSRRRRACATRRRRSTRRSPTSRRSRRRAARSRTSSGRSERC